MASASLFTEIHRSFQAGDYEKALKSAEKILQEESANLKALHCKIVCLIKLDRIDQALQLATTVNAPEVQFEKCYCLYRLKRVEEALEELKLCKATDFRVKELKAQALYRLEKFDESYALYLDLIKNSQDEYEDERETNLAAVAASLRKTGKEVSVDLGEQTYELCYNKACLEICSGNLESACSLLKKAEQLCIATLKEEDATDEEIEEEVKLIRAQLRMVDALLSIGPFENVLSSVEVDSIVTSNWFLAAKYKKTAKGDDEPSKKTKKNKKKKRRKRPLPKNYDPNVTPDPERWLPRWQRSTARVKKDKRKDVVGRGTQGAAVDASIESTSYAKPSQKASSSPPPGPRRQYANNKKRKPGRK